MKIIRAPFLGFCQGVRRAYNQVLKLIEALPHRPIVILGELVHNRAVMQDLIQRGVIVEEDYTSIKDSIVVTRTHGVAKKIIETLKQNNNEIVDLTCPIVQKVRAVANELINNQNVDCIVLVGQPDHPEIIATNSWIAKCFTVSTENDIENLPQVETVGVVAQTTFSKEQFDVIFEKIKKRFKNVFSYNTICPHTSLNQKKSKELAANVDLVVVVGDTASSNTRTLVEVCAAENPNTYLISQTADLESIKNLASFQTVLLTAGASAPDWIIDEIQSFLEKV